MKYSEPKYTNPQTAFETAIRAGVLTVKIATMNGRYVGDYMYMGDNDAGAHLFKHRQTRAYLPPVAPAGKAVQP